MFALFFSAFGLLLLLHINIISDKNNEIDYLTNLFQEIDEYSYELLEDIERNEEHIKVLNEAIDATYEEDQKQLNF